MTNSVIKNNDRSRFLRKSDVIWVMISNLMALICAVVIGLALPRLTDYDTYAGYRIYTLLIAYSGLLHLGFVDGLALRFGNLRYDELPLGRFRAYFIVFAVSQSLITVILLSVYLLLSGGRLSPIFFVLINMYLENIRVYFASITIFTGRFRIDSLLQIFYRVFLLSGFLYLLITGHDGWMMFLLYTTLLNTFAFMAAAFVNFRTVFGRVWDFSGIGKDISETVRRGFCVLAGEQFSLLIIGADSIFAWAFFDTKDFSLYSFAVYVVVTVFTVINSANTVIFPYLKRQAEGDVEERYRFLRDTSLILSTFAAILFFLCKPLIRMLLPGYSDCITYICILFGTLTFRTLQGMACTNTMKALDMEKEYFLCSLVCCAAAFALDAILAAFFHDMRLLAGASVLVYVIWFFACDHMIMRRLEAPPVTEMKLFPLLQLFLFYICTMIGDIPGSTLYMIFIAAFCMWYVKNGRNMREMKGTL